MALASTGSAASYDQTKKKLDLQPLLTSIILNDTAALGVIGMGPEALGRIHYFNQDSLNANFVTFTAALTSTSELAEDTAACSAADSTLIDVGALLMDEAEGKQEIFQVLTNASTAPVVVRGYGSTSAAEDHAAGAKFMIIGQAKQEGDKQVINRAKARIQKSNRTQIFKTEVTVTGTAEAEANNGLHPGVSSEQALQMLRRADELKVQINRAALYSIISGAASDAVYGSFRGLREWLTENSGGNKIETVEALSESVVNTMFRKAWDKGGSPTTFLAGADQATKFSTFNAGKVRVAANDRVAGSFTEKYLTNLGTEISVVIDRFARKDDAALIDTSRTWIAPLRGRGMFSEPLAKTGDLSEWQMISELTLVVQNQDEAHTYHTNLTV